MNGPSAADLAEQAVRYAKADYSVLPLHTVPDGRCSCGNPACKSPGKHPRLRDLVRDCIEQHVDERQMEIIRTAEESEREILRTWRPSERPAPP